MTASRNQASKGWLRSLTVLTQVGALSLGAALAHAQSSSPAPKTRYEYDAEGNPTKVVQGDGTLNLATRMAYDSLQRLIRQTDPADSLIQFSYNGRQDLTQVIDPRNLSTVYSLDGLAQRKALQSPDTGGASYSYDEAGNLKNITDAGNVKVSFSYDTLNRLTEAKHEQLGVPTPPPPLLHNWAYDQTGAGFSHGIGRLTSTSFPAGSRRYAYDAHGRLTQAVQELSQGGQSHSATVGYAYNSAGGLTQLTYPSGRVLTWTYVNGQPRSLSVTLTGGGQAVPVLQDLSWAAWSQVDGAAQPQSWNWVMASGGTWPHNRSYDEWGRLSAYPVGDQRRTLHYDDAGRIVAYVHGLGATVDCPMGTSGPNCEPDPGPCLPGDPGCIELGAMSMQPSNTGSSPLDQSFSYDAAGRLIRTQQGIKLWTYSHDATGNRSAHSTPTVASGSYSTDPNSNRLLSVSNPALALSYDSIGAVKTAGWSANYDFTGQISSLTSGGTTTTYAYDSDQRRVIKRQGAGGVVYVYGQQGELLGEYDLQSGEALREYLWLGSTPVAMIAKAQGQAQAELFYLHADHIDTPRVAIDRQGRKRWSWLAEPFGNEAASEQPSSPLPALTQNLRFPGQVFDQESGLHYNHHRYYDPKFGRYVQSDPIGLAGGINTYSYALNAPTMYVDLTGKAPKKLDHNSQECQDLRKKISNKKLDINKRIREIAENPNRLPYYPPYPGAPPRMSVQGHEDLVRDLKDYLENDEKLHKDKCDDPPPPPPPAEPVCGENCKRVLKGVRDAATGVILFVFVLVCASS